MDQHHVEYITEETSAVRTRRNHSKDQEVAPACRPVCLGLFFFLPLPVPTSSNPSRSTNEQVDVRLWLQHHLLSDEEARLRGVLLRSCL